MRAVNFDIPDLIARARAGKIHHAEFEQFMDPWGRRLSGGTPYIPNSTDAGRPDRLVDALTIRDVYCKQVSWAIFTSEYLDGMARLLNGYRVLEVCAGNGILQPLMRERGIAWTSTEKGQEGNEVKFYTNPIADLTYMDAETAVKEIPHDVIFASWIPYGSDLDQKLAALQRPMVIIGEGGGGCTGTDKFFSDYEDQIIYLPDGYADVPSWYGIRDHTILVWWDRLRRVTTRRLERVDG